MSIYAEWRAERPEPDEPEFRMARCTCLPQTTYFPAESDGCLLHGEDSE